MLLLLLFLVSLWMFFFWIWFVCFNWLFTKWHFLYRMLNVFLNLLIVSLGHIPQGVVEWLHSTSRTRVEFHIRHRRRIRPTLRPNTTWNGKSGEKRIIIKARVPVAATEPKLHTYLFEHGLRLFVGKEIWSHPTWSPFKCHFTSLGRSKRTQSFHTQILHRWPNLQIKCINSQFTDHRRSTKSTAYIWIIPLFAGLCQCVRYTAWE